MKRKTSAFVANIARVRRAALIGAGVAFVTAAVVRADAATPREPAWDAAAAAHYLDTRLDWWRHWPKAARDHDTSCISCHTALPHVLARPSLRMSLHETARSPAELAMFDDVTKRVYMWHDIDPFYTDQKNGMPKSGESRGVESVLNALFLVTRDNERGLFGTDTRQAFAQMWSMQIQTGEMKGGSRAADRLAADLSARRTDRPVALQPRADPDCRQRIARHCRPGPARRDCRRSCRCPRRRWRVEPARARPVAARRQIAVAHRKRRLCHCDRCLCLA
jgi:hypothetical protein